jgi:hypothetical protein
MAAVIVGVWIPMAALALYVLRSMGYWPRTWVGWVVALVVGPVVTLLPYALAVNLFERAFAVGDGARPRPVLRVIRAVVVLGIAFLGLLGLVWFAVGPLATVLHPLGPIALQHFERVR